MHPLVTSCGEDSVCSHRFSSIVFWWDIVRPQLLLRWLLLRVILCFLTFFDELCPPVPAIESNLSEEIPWKPGTVWIDCALADTLDA